MHIIILCVANEYSVCVPASATLVRPKPSRRTFLCATVTILPNPCRTNSSLIQKINKLLLAHAVEDRQKCASVHVMYRIMFFLHLILLHYYFEKAFETFQDSCYCQGNLGLWINLLGHFCSLFMKFKCIKMTCGRNGSHYSMRHGTTSSA